MNTIFPQAFSLNVDTGETNARLLNCLRDEINQSPTGKISFARFMEIALYEPKLGYYTSNLPKLGQEGDFITAPELSPLFAQCLAVCCQSVLEEVGDEGIILEVGAGTGRMAADLLLALEQRRCLPKKYQILEVSPALKKQQQNTLKHQVPHLLNNIEHLDEFPSSPTIKGLILANEVVDAFPVHKFFLQRGLMQECYVGWEKAQPVWKLAPPSSFLVAEALAKLHDKYLRGLNGAYSSEISMLLPDWIQHVGSVLSQGIVLLIDYGFPGYTYYHSARQSGTLQCHYRHRVHANPLLLVGLQDITASIDFSLVAESATYVGLEPIGFTSQAAFLLDCGLLEMIKAYAFVDQLTMNGWIQRLVSPNEMGEIIKILALGRSVAGLVLPGFSHYNRGSCLFNSHLYSL